MAKHRSPNCPQIPFSTAIEKGRRVYEKEHTHPAVKLVVAQDLGYKGLSGPSLAMLGALRQYGILEGTGDALKVSKDALAYYEMDDGPEREAAVNRMVFAPSLFSELRELYPDQLPSDGNLRHALITKGFSSDAAEDVIKVYKENLKLVTGEEYVFSGGEAHKPVDSVTKIIDGLFPSIPPKPTVSAVQNYSFALSPAARAELVLKGTITPEDLDLLRDHIELTIRALARKAKAE